jgi:hypothetical protein
MNHIYPAGSLVGNCLHCYEQLSGGFNQGFGLFGVRNLLVIEIISLFGG